MQTESKLGLENQLTEDARSGLMERRNELRFKFEVDIKVRPRNRASLKGHSVDISETGISATLALEVPSDEMVELEFVTPYGVVTAFAMVRQRNAFRYGFQFVQPTAAGIGLTCRYLANAAGSHV